VVEVGTPAQNAANRENAKKSTGPRTAAGKARSRMNAVKWGLASLSGLLLLPGESREELEAYEGALRADMKPVGAREELVFMEVSACGWRLRRALRIESGILALSLAGAEQRYLLGLRRAMQVVDRDVPGAKVAEFFGRQTAVENTNEEFLEDLNGRLEDALAAERTDAARLASGFINDATGPDSMGKLSRYETAIYRRLIQALATFQALQAARLADAEERE
jgi:hypothetical protein